MLSNEMGVASERNAGLEVRIQAADKTALIRGLFRKYAPEPKYGTKDDKRKFKGWSDIDSFDAVERCVSANKAVAKVNEAIAQLTGEPDELEGPSECPECKITFFSATHLKYHQMFIANEKKTEDDKTIIDLGSSDPSTGMLFCPWCPVLLQGPLVLIHHMKSCREKKNHTATLRTEVSEDFFCSDCQKLFEREEDMWRHVYVAHGLPYKCNRCPEQFTSKKQFKTHIVTCSGEESPRCSDCLKTFPRCRELLRHVTLNPHCKLAEPYVCEKCHISLTSRKLMLTHIWKHFRTSRIHAIDSDPNPCTRSIENEPFDPFKVPDFFKPRLVPKPPDSLKSPEKRTEAKYDHLQSPEPKKQSQMEEPVMRLETSDFLEQTDVLELTDPKHFQGFDDISGAGSVDGATDDRGPHPRKIPRSQIGNKKIIGFILDHPYCLPCSDYPKHSKRSKPKKSSSNKKPSPSKKSESNFSSKKGEDNKEEISRKKKKKSESTQSRKKNDFADLQNSDSYVGDTSIEKQLQKQFSSKKVEVSGNNRRIKSKPKKRAMGALVEVPSPDIVAIQSALPQEAPSPWDDDAGVMPMIQSVTSINDWNALPDASEPLSPMKRPKKKKKKKSKMKEVAIDENVLNFLKETGEDPSAYEFVFFSDSDDRETDADPIPIEDPTPVEKPSMDDDPIYIPMDEPILVGDSISNVDEVPIVDPIPIVEQLPVVEPAPVDGPVTVNALVPFVERAAPFESFTVTEPVSINQLILIHESMSVEQRQFFGQPPLGEDFEFIEESILVQDPQPIVEQSPADESVTIERITLPEDAILLPLLADSDTNTKKTASTKVAKRKKDVISNYDSIPMVLPLNSHLTDACLTDPWDTDRINSTGTVGKPSNKQSIVRTVSLPATFDTTMQRKTNTSPPLVVEQPNNIPYSIQRLLSEEFPGYVVLDDNPCPKQWVPLTNCLPRGTMPPLQPIISNTNDTVVISDTPDADMGLLSLALAAEAMVNKKGGTPAQSPGNSLSVDNFKIVDNTDKQSTQRGLAPYKNPLPSLCSFRMPTPNEEVTEVIFNKNVRSANFSPVIPRIPASKLPQTSIIDVDTNCKDPSAPQTGQENKAAELRPLSNLGSTSILNKKTTVAKSSQSSRPASSADLSAKPKSSEEHQTLSSFSCSKTPSEDKRSAPENWERAEADGGKVPSLGAWSPVSSHNDDDFPDELNESDWDFDNPVSPSYSFVDDGDDSPVNADSDSFMNNSSPERMDTLENVPLTDLKVVLTRLDDSKKSKKSSEVISRTKADHVCPDCGRSFKTESGVKIHRSRGTKGCGFTISSYLEKLARTTKPLPVSPGKNRSLEQRKLIQAELSDLSSSLNDILPEASAEEWYKPAEDDEKTVDKPELTCECCIRPFKSSLALKIHRSKMSLKATETADKSTAVEVKLALEDGKVAKEQQVSLKAAEAAAKDTAVEVKPALEDGKVAKEQQVSLNAAEAAAKDTAVEVKPALEDGKVTKEQQESLNAAEAAAKNTAVEVEHALEDGKVTKEQQESLNAAETAAKNTAVEVEPAFEDGEVAKEQQGLEIPGSDTFALLENTQYQSSDTDKEDVSKLIHILNQDLKSANKSPEDKEDVGKAGKETDNVKRAEEEGTSSEKDPATVDKMGSAETPVSEPTEKRNEIPSCDDIVEDAFKVTETVDASCMLPVAEDVEGLAESGIPKPSTGCERFIGSGGSEPPVYVCSYCYRKFFNETSLKIHLAWEKKREKRRRALQEFIPKVTSDGQIQLVDVRHKAKNSSASSRRNVSSRRSFNEASLKILASSKKKRRKRRTIIGDKTPNSELGSESAVERTNISDSSLNKKIFSDSTTESKLASQPTGQSKLIFESSEELKTNCELKTILDSALELDKPPLLDSDDKRFLDKESAVKPESEEQFFAEISKKILMAVESELSARSPQKDNVKGADKSNIAPSESATVPAAPSEGGRETGICANAVNEISSEEALVLVPSVTVEPSVTKTATPKKTMSRKKFTSPRKSPLRPKAEAFKMSRSGRRIKKKRRFGVDEYSFIPKALKIFKPLKRVNVGIVINSQGTPAASEAATPVVTESATPVVTESAAPVAILGATVVATPATKRATPVEVEFATSFRAEIATPATADVPTPVTAEIATPVIAEVAKPDTMEVVKPVYAQDAALDTMEGTLSEEAAVQAILPASGSSPADKSAVSYQCSHCLETFPSKHKLGSHTRHHCKKYKPRNLSVSKHLKASRTCKSCKTLFNTYNLLIIHYKLTKNCRKRQRENSAVESSKAESSTADTSSAIPSGRAADKVPIRGRPTFACKICGRVFRNQRSLRTHRWQRLKRGSSKTFCVPISMKSVLSEANEDGASQPGMIANPSKAVTRKERCGSKFTLKKLRKTRQDLLSSSETNPDLPSSALANGVVSGFLCHGCGREFKSLWALKSHRYHNKTDSPCRRKAESENSFETARYKPVVASDEDSGQNIYPCTCFRVFNSLRSLRMHRTQSGHPETPSLSAAECKTDVESPSAEVTDQTKTLSCDTCGREFSTVAALGTHKYRAVNSGGKSCSPKRYSTEAPGASTDAEKTAYSASGEGSVEASFESAKDLSSDASFTSAKGDECAVLPAESARSEVPAEALPSAEMETSKVSICHLCQRTFPSVRSLGMHLHHQKRRGFCGLNTSTAFVDNTVLSSSLLVENDDTNDSSVAPSLPLDETALGFDPKTDEDSAQQSVTLRDPDGLKWDDLSESSSLLTSEGNTKSESRRSRSSKEKKMSLKSLYKCDFCSTNYSYLKSLFRHVETAHENGEFKCDDCGMTFHSVQGLQIHVMTKESKLFKSAFVPVEANRTDEQAPSSKDEFAAREDENSLEETNSTRAVAVAVATTKPLKRGKRKKKLDSLNAQERAEYVTTDEARIEDVPGEISGLTPAVGSATTKPGKRRKRKKKPGVEVPADENGAAPTSGAPKKRGRRRKKRRQADPNAPEEESTLTASVDGPKKSRDRKRKVGDQNVAEGKSTLPSTAEAQVTPRKRKKISGDMTPPGDEINSSVETPKSSEDEKKNPIGIEAEATAVTTKANENVKPEAGAKSDKKPKPEDETESEGNLKPKTEGNLKLKTEEDSDRKPRPKAEALSDEKLKPEVEAQLDKMLKPEAKSQDHLKLEAAPKVENASPSSGDSLAKPEKRKVVDLLSPVSSPELGSPIRKRRSAKTDSDSEVPQSPSTPCRSLRSTARGPPVSDSEDPCSPMPTRSVTFILSFENKNVRFVSLKCYPHQPPNPTVHCSECKQCMMKEQIREHDCESSHFICMCQKCRLYFPYDQYILMDSNSKGRLSASPSSTELDAKLKTVSTVTPDTNPTFKCLTTLSIESCKIKQCALCGEVTDSFSKLEKHLKLVHTKLLTCLKCGTCFSETKAWESHVQWDTCSCRRSPLKADCGQDRPGIDETCPTESASLEERPQHLCDHCKTSFESIEKLESHSCSQRSASSRKLFRCNSCSSWFQNELMMRTHKKEDCCNE